MVREKVLKLVEMLDILKAHLMVLMVHQRDLKLVDMMAHSMVH